MSQLTYTNLQTRTAYLMGETSASTILQSHINASIQDIVLLHPWSWTLKKTTGSLSSGTFSLASDYNAKFGIADARILGSSSSDDHIFERIPVEDRDLYTEEDYKYWVTWDTTLAVHVFNTHASTTGTVTYHYYFFPADLSAGADKCIVPDSEAVAYLAASKMWVGDERNSQLQQLYSQEASNRVRDLKVADLNTTTDSMTMGSVLDYNPSFRSR